LLKIIALKVQLHLQQQLKKPSAPADVATPVTQEASTDGQILASPLAKENRK
jgi:hypothetical protein